MLLLMKWTIGRSRRLEGRARRWRREGGGSHWLRGAWGLRVVLDLVLCDTTGMERSLHLSDALGVTTTKAQTLYASTSFLLRLRHALLPNAWLGSGVGATAMCL